MVKMSLELATHNHVGNSRAMQCDVCKVEGTNCVFANGRKGKITQAKLYRVYKGKVAKIKLCHLHDIELFMLGEFKFLKEHINLAMDICSLLAVLARKYVRTFCPRMRLKHVPCRII